MQSDLSLSQENKRKEEVDMLEIIHADASAFCKKMKKHEKLESKGRKERKNGNGKWAR